MNLLALVAVFLVGFILGVGSALLYIQYSMYSQFGKIEEQIQQVSNMEEDLLNNDLDKDE